MNASELTFGVELEVTMPAANCPAVGGYHRGVQIVGLPAGWNAQSDSSIQVTSRGHIGVEIVSPVLRGADGLAQVKAVVEWLRERGAKVNGSTGFHVHVGVTRGDADLLARIATLTANFEKAIYASTGTRSREQGRYCQPIQSSQAFRTRFVEGQSSFVSRYHTLNVTNLDGGSKPTVEFRAFAGTLNTIKIFGYIRMCLGIVEKAYSMKRTAKWVAKTPVETSPIHRNGEGQTALTRLFYALGWTKGRESHVYGDVSTESGPSIQTCKRKLMEMARKYDGGN